MLKLKNVSKFYYSNGIVTSGFSRVNLELRRGEFVAITGESGSGKSTLLNVISGLDSYEEGEMYINGEETSAYSNADFENYRRRYIANIYQSFNLINSYTVYQNVEMVLLLAKMKKRDIRKKVLEVLKQVDLYKFRNTKASRLSGGQKQRVAIARALVKDTPIIVADEPTGNLDSESAANVISLLSKLASDRLVIVVTHNYEQVEPYVTRKITMHDGRITEDLTIRDALNVSDKFGASGDRDEMEALSAPDRQAMEIKPADAPDNAVSGKKEIDYAADMDPERQGKKHLALGARIRLGMRNAFNVVPKFLLLLFVFLFICVALTGFYSNMRSQAYESEVSGYNRFFEKTGDKRIVIKKADGSPITGDDFAALEKMSNVDYVFKDDVLLDSSVYMEYSETTPEGYYKGYSFNGSLEKMSSFPYTAEQLTYGRMPADDNEILLIIPEYNYINSPETINDVFEGEFTLYSGRDGADLYGSKLKIVGVVVEEDGSWQLPFYVSDGVMDKARNNLNNSFSTMVVKTGNYTFESNRYSSQNRVVPTDKVQPGTALVPEDWNWYYKKLKAKGQTLSVEISNLYYTDSLTLKIADTYNKKTFTNKTGLKDYEYNNGVIMVNADDYNSLFDKDSFQASVFIKTPEFAGRTLSELKEKGYYPLYIKDAIQQYDRTWAVVDTIFNNLWSGALVVGLFFISYFIIKLIMKSRNTYYATVRMLGGSRGDCKSLLVVELLTVMNLAFILIIAALVCAHLGLYQLEATDLVIQYMRLKDYVTLYVVLLCMSVIISLRYARQLFKKTAMNIYKEV